MAKRKKNRKRKKHSARCFYARWLAGEFDSYKIKQPYCDCGVGFSDKKLKEFQQGTKEKVVIEIIENCSVEWDKRRGVLYVHNKDTGATVLRVCRLPACNNNVRLSTGQIDINAFPEGVSMP